MHYGEEDGFFYVLSGGRQIALSRSPDLRSWEQAPAALAGGYTRAHLAGHHDARLRGVRTFAWTKEGRVETVDQSTLVRLLGKLELVVLNGCSTEKLCETITDRRVPAIGWSTVAADVPAKLSSIGLFGCLARRLGKRLSGRDVREAFEQREEEDRRVHVKV